jgi:hypothetical protein
MVADSLFFPAIGGTYSRQHRTDNLAVYPLHLALIA